MTERTSTQVSGSGDQAHATHENNTALFLKVFGALCVLTAISFGIASSPLMNSRSLAWASMMVVSCAKAFLVISFFMHLKWERAWKYVLTIPALLMSLFLVLSLVPDIAMRSEAYSSTRWLHATEPGSLTAENEPEGPTEATPSANGPAPDGETEGSEDADSKGASEDNPSGDSGQ